MSLIHRQTTEAMAEANRASSLKSTGPVTDNGKLHARMNALQHGMRGQAGPVIRELRESEEDLEELRMQFWHKLRPRGEFEVALVDQLTENRWRRRRVLRAESSLLVAHRLQFDLDHGRARAGEGRSPSSAGEARLAKQVGLASLPDSGAKFTFILQCLRAARQAVETEGFGEGGSKRLEAVYGPDPGLAGAALLARYRECQKAAFAPDSSSAPEEEFRAHRTEFLALLDAEISSFQKLQELHQASCDELAAARRETLQILPSDDLNRILRYENFLDRQYERLLKQFEQRQAAAGEDRADRAYRQSPQPGAMFPPRAGRNLRKIAERSRQLIENKGQNY